MLLDGTYATWRPDLPGKEKDVVMVIADNPLGAVFVGELDIIGGWLCICVDAYV